MALTMAGGRVLGWGAGSAAEYFDQSGRQRGPLPCKHDVHVSLGMTLRTSQVTKTEFIFQATISALGC